MNSALLFVLIQYNTKFVIAMLPRFCAEAHIYKEWFRRVPLLILMVTKTYVIFELDISLMTVAFDPIYFNKSC